MSIDDLPALNASLNATSAILVSLGFIAIKRRKVKLHKALMITAVVVSAAFLTSYVTFHYFGEENRFQGTGVIRILYFAMLISHVLLAITIVPLVLRTVYLGWRNRLDRHVRLARWTLPLWMYVSVTGVAIYFCLY